MVDTCQAQSMHQQFYSPNILAVGSSKVGEDSLSVSQVVVMKCQTNFSLTMNEVKTKSTAYITLFQCSFASITVTQKLEFMLLTDTHIMFYNSWRE